ncbi:MAG: YceD family protein [Chlamydiales bacterium]
MDDTFKIYVDRLQEGEKEELKESLSPAFLGVEEREFSFLHPVQLEGHAFVTGDSFIFTFSVCTKATILCAICNAPVEVVLQIPEVTHLEKVRDVRGGVFYFTDILREAILLEIPHTAECQKGNCPERNELKKYLSKDKYTHCPFKELIGENNGGTT